MNTSAEQPCARSRAEDATIAWFPAALASIGTAKPVVTSDGEGPQRKVKLRAFGLDRYAVTNARFATFVDETGYVTDAERYGWSFVFHMFVAEGLMTSQPVGLPWWHKVQGAFWRVPEGPGSDLAGRDNHPVVHVSWKDAMAFATWAGGRLPTEAQWEHGARAGRGDVRFPWGDDEPNDEAVYCNIWQGRFPNMNTAANGHVGTAPADAFDPNPAGLYNMCGNVWEWCSDSYRVRSMTREAKERNKQALAESEKVMKGGSYLCHVSYCYRYRIAARIGHSPDTSTGHIGFRLAYDAP